MKSETAQILTQQAQWIVERIERINEGLMTRSSVAIGFLGVELALVGPKEHKGADYYQLATLGLLVISIGFFIAALWSFKSSTLPNFNEIEQSLTATNAVQIKTPLNQLIMAKNKDKSIYSSLVKENNRRGWTYETGLIFLVLSQISLAVFMIIGRGSGI